MPIIWNRIYILITKKKTLSCIDSKTPRAASVYECAKGNKNDI